MSAASPESSPKAAKGTVLREISQLFLRLFTGFGLIFYQGWTQAVSAWYCMWEDREWQISKLVGSSPVAITLVFALLACSVGIILGFLTRLNAAIVLVLLFIILWFNLPLSASFTSQTRFLYLGLCVALIIGGGGYLSLDRLFVRKRKPKKENQSYMFR